MGHENPTITDCVRQSGGAYLIGDANAPEVVLNFAKKHEVDIVFVNADEPLANGAVDVLLKITLKPSAPPGMPPELSGIKIYSMEMMQEICPQFTPFYRVVSDKKSLQEAVQTFIIKIYKSRLNRKG